MSDEIKFRIKDVGAYLKSVNENNIGIQGLEHIGTLLENIGLIENSDKPYLTRRGKEALGSYEKVIKTMNEISGAQKTFVG